MGAARTGPGMLLSFTVTWSPGLNVPWPQQQRAAPGTRPAFLHLWVGVGGCSSLAPGVETAPCPVQGPGPVTALPSLPLSPGSLWGSDFSLISAHLITCSFIPEEEVRTARGPSPSA